MLLAGEAIGEHVVGRQLGEGPLAATWLLTDGQGEPTGVLRVLVVALQDFDARFRRSAQVLKELSHPNLVTVSELLDVKGRLGVVSEYVAGGNLAEWLRRGDRSPGRILPMFLSIARGLAAAHRVGLIHRNLKPSKVLVTLQGHPKVAGFALGKLRLPELDEVTEVGTTFGSPPYMPPEQFRGVGQVDARADLFALGCILYEMFTGARAFPGSDLMEVYRRVVAGEYAPLPAEVPASLVGVVADLLDPDPELRPPSTDALVARLLEDPDLVGFLPERPAEAQVSDDEEDPEPLPTREEDAADSGARLGRSPPVPTRSRGGPPSLPPPPSLRHTSVDVVAAPASLSRPASAVEVPARPEPLPGPAGPPPPVWPIVAVAAAAISLLLALAGMVLAYSLT